MRAAVKSAIPHMVAWQPWRVERRIAERSPNAPDRGGEGEGNRVKIPLSIEPWATRGGAAGKFDTPRPNEPGATGEVAAQANGRERLPSNEPGATVEAKRTQDPVWF
jgi:hypothetical protein